MNNLEVGVDPIFPPVDVLGAIGNELAPADALSEQYYELAYSVSHARSERKRYASLSDESRSGILPLPEQQEAARCRFYEGDCRLDTSPRR